MDETQNDAPFVAFYDMHAVTFVLPDEMADVTIAGQFSVRSTLTLSQMTNFRLLQIERVCRPQFKI